MSRQVMMVPQDWEHPKKEDGKYQPMFFEYWPDVIADWMKEYKLWQKGQHPDQLDTDYDTDGVRYHEWAGFPDPDCYMHERILEENRTHYQMYETTSEGTPISPVFKTAEELARWLTDNRASAFADMTCSYDQWLAMINGPGSSFSAALIGGKLISGVEAIND